MSISLLITSATFAAPDIQSALDAVYPALVRIHVVSENGYSGRMQKNRGTGSGTIIHPDGYVLTNHHVAGRATRMTVRLADRQECRATLIGTDPLSDLAILKINRHDLRDPNAPLPVARFGDSDSLQVGDVVLAMGSPAGLSQSVTKGVVANTQMIAPAGSGSFSLDGEAVGELVRWIGHDAVIYPGNSGGPLVNLQGEIVGVNEVGIGSLGGAIPSNLAEKIAKILISKGEVQRSSIGISFQPLLKQTKVNKGILVSGTVDGSPSARAGLLPGDIITSINEHKITAARAPEDVPIINRIILESPIGAELTICGLRNDKLMTWTVKTETREPIQPREKEFLAWGITAHNLTRLHTIERHYDSDGAVVIQSVRPGGPIASAKPAPAAGSLITSINGKKVTNCENLEAITSELTRNAISPVPALVSYEHDGKSYLTIVHVGIEKPYEQVALARKAWLGVSTQMISSDLAQALGLPGQQGMRVTAVYPHSQAEKAGIQKGDLLLKLDGEAIHASRPEEAEILTEAIRQRSVHSKVNLELRRGEKILQIQVPLELSPNSIHDLQEYHSELLEFKARNLCKEDQLRKGAKNSEKGVLITSVANAGWAALADLQGKDLLLEIDGKPIDSIFTLRDVINNIEKNKPSCITFFIKRGIHTRMIEIEPNW